MAGEFKETELGALLSFANGRSSPDRANGLPYPVYGSNGIIGYAAEANANACSIIIGRVGNYCGSLYLSKEPCWVTDNAIRATAREGSDPRFLFYLLATLNLNTWRVGSGQPLLNQDILRRIPTAAPQLPEQRAIADVLGALDDKIEQNRRTARALERLARAIFQAWFVDFEPVKAKAAGETSFLSMAQPAFDALPTRLVDSEIGPVPEGWKIGTVADLGEVICGKTPPTNKPENYGNDVYFITIPDMHGKVFVTDTGKKLSFTGANTQKQKYLPANSICVSCIATPGLVVMTSDRAQTNQQINSIIPREDVSPYYCYETLSRLGAQIRAGGSGGSVFHNLNKSRFSALKILLPPKEVVSLFHGTVAPLFEKILANQKEPRKLEELRDFLVPKLLSGQVRVDVDTAGSEIPI